MAELVGVVASGVGIGALAASITKSVIKIKSFWDDMRDVPDDIGDLMEQIEGLQYLLSHIEDGQSRNPYPSFLLDRSSMARCLSICKRTADQLKTIADDLSVDIHTNKKIHKKWASAKVVLKKDKLEKYQRKLRGAVSLLSLSHQSYQIALTQLQPDIIVAKLLRSPASSTSIAYSSDNLYPPSIVRREGLEQPSQNKKQLIIHDDYSWHYRGFFGAWTYRKRRYKSAKATALQQSIGTDEVHEYTTCFYAPQWLINQIWSLHAVSAASGWTYKPRMMNIIPRDSRLFKCSARGDFQGVRELFASREASPFDCDEEGYTVLHLASLLGNVGLFRFFIQQGADADYLSAPGQPPGVMISFNKFKSVTILKFLRFLLVEAEITPPLLTEFYFRSAAYFRVVQNLVEPEYYARPLKERISFAKRACFATANASRLAISRDSKIPVEAIEHRDGNGETLIYGLAFHIAGLTDERYRETTQMDDKELQGWRSMLNELLSNGADLFVINCNRRTPLLWLIDFYLLLEYRLQGYQELNNVKTFTGDSPPIVRWLGSLQACGVDLLQYGATEVAPHEKGLTSWNFPAYARGCTYDLTNFQYGPNLSDWKLVFELVWREVKVDVPGGWVEDNIEEHEDIQRNHYKLKGSI